VEGFTYDALPMHVVFEAGALARLPDEAARLSLNRVLVVSTPGQQALGTRAADLLGARAVGLHAKARMHVPSAIAATAVRRAQTDNTDGVVAVGGGSAIGLGKIIARDTGLPMLAIPTTYSGSEMTPIWGLTEDGIKTTGRDSKVLPKGVIYDPELTVGLPPGVTATSGMNAMAHAVEALYAVDANPITSTMAEQAIAALARGLPRVMESPANLDARSDALYGACLAGAVISDAVQRSVVQLPTGAWYDPVEPGGLDAHGNPNVLTLDKGTSKLAQGSSAHSALVEVERFEGTPPPVRAFTPPPMISRLRKARA
jgi:maleylacetate reductase